MQVEKIMSACRICPRNCGANRTIGQKGQCGAGLLPKIALVSTHMWEEYPISGTKGSGTVFFSHCNLRCVFCQNYTISTEGYGIEVTINRLAEIFLEQQARGVHNINLVSAAQYLPQTAQALQLAKESGLHIPVVYNTNGYETVASLRWLEGLVDIYLPDFKYVSQETASRYSHAADYAKIAEAALAEMRRQQSQDIFYADGLMQKGMIVRHMVLPGQYRDSFLVLEKIKEVLGEDTYVSLLRQYTPLYRATEYREINRLLTSFEYDKVIDHFFQIGLHHGYMQEKSAAKAAYTPLFNGEGVRRGI